MLDSILTRTLTAAALAGAVILGPTPPAAMGAPGYLSRPPDRTPPGAVADLAIGPSPNGYITLSWTAVGDDGPACAQCFSNSTPATSYDLRYSTAAPGGDLNAWFSAATQATGEPAPNGCGCLDSLCLSGLAPSTTYYLGLRALDEAGNASPVSNIVSGQVGTATGAMHISAVGSSWSYAGGPKRRGLAFVNIVDALGAPVPCATVTVQWSGCYGDTASGVTDATGRARIVSNRTANCANTQCCFIVTVTGVSHTAYTYDSGANAATTRAGDCAPLLPSVCPPLAMAGCEADVNGDGVLNSADYFQFMQWFFDGAPESDFNADGIGDSQDFFDFLAAFFAGCP